MTTFILLTDGLIDRAREEQKTACGPTAAREFAICITALEDAQMRFNRGMALKNGTFAVGDVEAIVDAKEAEAVAEAISLGEQMDVDEVLAVKAAEEALAAGETYGPAAV